jgi:aminoglycoside phosphotransferase (APT) family kinase protein
MKTKHDFDVTIALTNQTLTHVIEKLLPQRQIASAQPLSGGLINTNLKIDFRSDHDPIVLRIYRDGASACRKELALHDLIQRKVRVPRLLHVEANGFEEVPPFAILEFVEGMTFQQLKRTGELKAIHEAAYSVGETLAAIGTFHFPESGQLVAKGDQICVGSAFIEGPNPVPRLLDTFLTSSNCQARAGSKLIDQISRFAWARAAEIPDLESARSLVHNDFGNRNILVHEANGCWSVAAVLDWELAFSGSPLLDVGNFLRYERANQPLREPYFSRGFVEHGGYLPENWREIVRVIDLTGLVECLTHENLPADVESELLELIQATIEQRDWNNQ